MASKKPLTPEERQAKIDQDIQKFLDNGGAITHVEPGVSGENPWTADAPTRPCTRVKLPHRIAPGFTI